MADNKDYQYIARPKGKPDERLKGKTNKWSNSYAEFIPQGTCENQREMIMQLGDTSFYKTTGKKESSWSVYLKCDSKSANSEVTVCSFVSCPVWIAAVCTFLMICLVVSWEMCIFALSYTIKSRI